MRKIKILAAAAFMALPMGAVAAPPAAACPDGACGKCRVNKPVEVDPDGTITISDRRLVECYY